MELSTDNIELLAKKCGKKISHNENLLDSFKESSEQSNALYKYISLVIKWNKSMNLVGKNTWDDLFKTQIIDSLFLADFISQNCKNKQIKTLDLGAGAGLPGIPLRCLWQSGEYLLVEPRQKRSIFMRTALREIGLPNTEVFQGRAEDLPAAKLPADIVLSKAFMPWEKLLPFVKDMIGENGLLIVLSNDPAPNSEDVLKAGYTLKSTFEYEAVGKKRYFWSLSPTNCSI